jgi:hypothetical protein
MIDRMPDLTKSLTQYETNLNKIIDEAHARSTRLIILTQPTLWRADLDEEAEALLWFGWIDESQPTARGYYSTRVLARAMQEFNDTLTRTCLRQQVEVIDLASRLPKDTSVFYDDCHLNANGSRMAASIITRYLADEAPYRLPP